jgi:hypothetical protein
VNQILFDIIPVLPSNNHHETFIVSINHTVRSVLDYGDILLERRRRQEPFARTHIGAFFGEIR